MTVGGRGGRPTRRVDVDESSGVEVDGGAVAPEPREVHALNKPAGVVSTASDTHGRPVVTDLVESERRLYPVGRLDADTTGLILLTNDGELAELLTHPRHEVPKTYRATRRARPTWAQPALRALREGVELDDGPTAPAGARLVEPGVIELELREGRKRQVRRMCEAVGHRGDRARAGGLRPAAAGGAGGRASRDALTAAEVERLREAASPIASRAVRLRALRGATTVRRERRRGDRRGHRGAGARGDGAQLARARGHGELPVHLHRRPGRRVPRARRPQPRPERRAAAVHPRDRRARLAAAARSA